VKEIPLELKIGFKGIFDGKVYKMLLSVLGQ